MADASVALPTVAAVVRERMNVSWSRARQLCIDGRVKIDGRQCTDPASRVAPGASVAIDPHAPKQSAASPLGETAIVFCDSEVVVVDKPAGMLSVADEDGNRDTLVDHTRTLLRKTRRYGADTALGVVHRLDKDTSGLMMFTRSAHAKRVLAEQFREHTIERVYHAIAHGDVPATTMDTFLVLDRGDAMRGSHGHFVRTADEPPPEARRAITYLRPVAALADATLVECRLETGRQHQIRIHLSEIGHPLVGERVYIRDYRGPKIVAARPMLHARTLGFAHPRTGKIISFERDPPEDFDSMIASLQPAPPSR